MITWKKLIVDTAIADFYLAAERLRATIDRERGFLNWAIKNNWWLFPLPETLVRKIWERFVEKESER